MKRTITTFFFACLFATGVQAQTAPTTPATTAGNVSRVTYFDVLPGKNNEFTTFLRTHTKPILDEQVKQGLIVSYSYFTKPGTDGPGDWDMGQIVTFKNYADAIDFNAERGAKLNAIGLAHYGTDEARTKANDSTTPMRTVVSSYLVRGMILNPMPN
jgi:hypothetical protein